MMKTRLLTEADEWSAAFMPWRSNPDSLWLKADLRELRDLAEYQSLKALALAKLCLKEFPDADDPV